ncbi:MAG TPA: surface carbohydrate biosynthesis protein [Gemmatimonadaceae bacterium]
MTPRVALIVDHPQRDLAGLVLTAFELCQHGVTCHLVPLNVQDTELGALAPDFVLLNYLRRYNEPLIRQLARAGIAYGLLDTEGGVFPSHREYADMLCTDPAMLHGASVICMWGPRLAEAMVQAGAFPAARVRVTGCPRFDLYAPMWRGVLEPTAADTRDTAPRILINTNYSVVNPRFTTTEQNLRACREVLNWSAETVADYTGKETVAIQETIAIAQQLARDFPRCTVVVRPHPHESAEPYERALRGLANIEFNLAGQVQEQILRAVAVVQRSCTTAIESALCDVPTLSPRWIAAPWEMPMAEAVSVPCASYAAMRARVEEMLAGRYEPSAELRAATETVVRDWFHARDGLAFRRVSDAVLAALADRNASDDRHAGRHVNPRRCARLLHGLDGPGLAPDAMQRRRHVDGLSRRVRFAFRLSPDWSFRHMRAVPSERWERSDKRFGTDDVRAIIARIEGVFAANGWPAEPVSAALGAGGAGGERGGRGGRGYGRFSQRAVTMWCAQRSESRGAPVHASHSRVAAAAGGRAS